MHPAGPGSGLEVGEEAAAILGARGRECAGVDDHECRKDVGEPAAEVDDERLEARRQLFGDRAALGAFHCRELLIEEQHRYVVGGDEQGRRQRRGADHERQVSRL